MTGSLLTASLDLTQVHRGVTGVLTLMRNSTPLMRAIGARLRDNTQHRLGGTTAPDGSAWTPLNPAYAAVKTQQGMLKERGMAGGLQGSMTFEAGRNQVEVGSNKIYAAIHQFGGKIVPKNAAALVFRLGDRIVRLKSVSIPARPYLGISTEDEAMIYRTVDGAIERALYGRAV